MQMIRYIIHRPIAVMMIVLAMVVLSLLAAYRLPVSLLPDVDVPQVKVLVDMPGAAASQVEERSLRLLRGRLSQLSGLESMQSEARADAGTITLDFVPGSQMDLLTIEVNEKLDMAMASLPKDMQRPKVMKTSVSDIPAFYVDMTLKNVHASSQRFSDMSDVAVNVVRRRLEQLPQTAMVDMSGMMGEQIMVTPDNEICRSLGLSTSDIEQALTDNNIRLEALSVVDGRFRYNVHFDAQLLTANDISNICINHGGRMVRLADLCTVEVLSGIRQGWVRHDGKPAVTMAVVKQRDARMADLKESVDSALTDLRGMYPQIDFSITRDQTSLLSYSLDNLEGNLLAGCLFTCLVLVVFLHSWRLSLIVAFTIPLSLLLTLLSFRLTNITLNVISISGLILGVGMIVDNAIIVTDNIVQKWKRGLPLEHAVCLATSEVFTPMLSSVLTTCSVFVPLMFLSGLAGELFYDMSVGISVSLVVSLAVAMTVVPVLFFTIYRKRSYCFRNGIRLDVEMQKWHERISCAVMRHQRLCFGFFGLAVVGVFVFYGLIDKQRMPQLSHDDMQLRVNWNEGVTEEENDRRINGVMHGIAGKVKTTSSMAGSQAFVLSHGQDLTSCEALAYVKCGETGQLDSLQKSISAYFRTHYPLASVNFETVGNPFDLILNTQEHDLVLRIKTADDKRPPVTLAVDIQQELQNRFPHIHIPQVQLADNIVCRVDVGNMAFYGMSYASLFSRLKQLAGTNSMLEISNGERSVPVIVGNRAMDWDAIKASTVNNRQGVDIPIEYLLKDSLVKDYKSLYASEMSDYYPLCIDAPSAEVRGVMTYADSLQHMRNDLRVDYVGGYFSSRALVTELFVVLLVALTLLYLILAAQFESLIQPLIILSEMVINTCVVMALLWALGESLNLMSMIGLVVMSGIVINDSILKIDTINRKCREGKVLLKAVMEAGSQRLRPIVMTSATTVFAMLPFLSRGSMGADLQFPLSLTIVVGMIVGTFVSLFFIPLTYYFIYKRQ